jgi:hypothetical protein
MLTDLPFMSSIFSHITPCSCLKVNWRFRWTFCIFGDEEKAKQKRQCQIRSKQNLKTEVNVLPKRRLTFNALHGVYLRRYNSSLLLNFEARIYQHLNSYWKVTCSNLGPQMDCNPMFRATRHVSISNEAMTSSFHIFQFIIHNNHPNIRRNLIPRYWWKK